MAYRCPNLGAGRPRREIVNVIRCICIYYYSRIRRAGAGGRMPPNYQLSDRIGFRGSGGMAAPLAGGSVGNSNGGAARFGAAGLRG